MKAPVWVAGEVLIDLIPTGNETGADRQTIVGGGPANTAKALARLGYETYFIDGISTDSYGQMARSELLADGVNLDYAHTSINPTCTATVSLDPAGGQSCATPRVCPAEPWRGACPRPSPSGPDRGRAS